MYSVILNNLVEDMEPEYIHRLIAGTREGGVDYLAPQQNATRAQVAVILMRYLGAA